MQHLAQYRLRSKINGCSNHGWFNHKQVGAPLIQPQLIQPKRGWDPALVQPQLIQPKTGRTHIWINRNWSPDDQRTTAVETTGPCRFFQPAINHSWNTSSYQLINIESSWFNQPRLNQPKMGWDPALTQPAIQPLNRVTAEKLLIQLHFNGPNISNGAYRALNGHVYTRKLRSFMAVLWALCASRPSS